MKPARRRSLKTDARAIFRAGLRAAHAGEAVYQYTRIEKNESGETLVCGDQKIPLEKTKRIIVLGGGKASAQMGRALERRLGGRIWGGAIVTQYGHAETCRRVEILEAAHPVPDVAGVAASKKIEKWAESAGEEDLVICLLSGGGSALMPAPADGVSLADKQAVTASLLRAGAPIEALNCVRKHLSALKGGNLARKAFPARMVVLLASDVIDDPLDVIASGPAVGDSSTFAEAEAYLQAYGVWRETPASVRRRLEAGCRGEMPDTPAPGAEIFRRVRHHVVANNGVALGAARRQARSMGYSASIETRSLRGEAREVGKSLAEEARRLAARSSENASPRCLLYGGETTVRVVGDGLGGRCQELALAFAMEICGLGNVCLLAAGTDGRDGPTEAAGAIVDGGTAKRKQNQDVDPAACLRDNDSHRFLRSRCACVLTGASGTNVMDLVIMLIR